VSRSAVPVTRKTQIHFLVVYYEIKYSSITPLVIFFKLLNILLTLAIANKWLKGTTEAVGFIKCHHVEEIRSVSFYILVLLIIL